MLARAFARRRPRRRRGSADPRTRAPPPRADRRAGESARLRVRSGSRRPWRAGSGETPQRGAHASTGPSGRSKTSPIFWIFRTLLRNVQKANQHGRCRVCSARARAPATSERQLHRRRRRGCSSTRSRRCSPSARRGRLRAVLAAPSSAAARERRVAAAARRLAPRSTCSPPRRRRSSAASSPTRSRSTAPRAGMECAAAPAARAAAADDADAPPPPFACPARAWRALGFQQDNHALGHPRRRRAAARAARHARARPRRARARAQLARRGSRARVARARARGDEPDCAVGRVAGVHVTSPLATAALRHAGRARGAAVARASRSLPRARPALRAARARARPRRPPSRPRRLPWWPAAR